jgi:hypothetical protein
MVNGYQGTSVPQEHGTFIFRVQQSREGMESVTLKMEVEWYSEMSVIFFQ